MCKGITVATREAVAVAGGEGSMVASRNFCQPSRWRRHMPYAFLGSTSSSNLSTISFNMLVLKILNDHKLLERIWEIPLREDLPESELDLPWTSVGIVSSIIGSS